MVIDSPPVAIESLVDSLKAAVGEQTELTAERVKALVEQSGITQADLEPYAAFEHDPADGYGRKMIYDGGSFEIMAMSWNPGDYSSIHNHGYTQWGVVQVFGNVHHFIYKIKDNKIDFAKREILPAGATVKVVNAMVHQMGNPSTGRYMTLHIYGSNTRQSAVTADARNYELEFDRVTHTTGGAFMNLPESQIYDFEPGPTPTKEVFLNYAKLLLDYYERQKQTPKIVSLKQALVRKLESRICS